MYKQIEPLPTEGKMILDYGQEITLQEALFKAGHSWIDTNGEPHTDIIKVPSIGWNAGKKLYWCDLHSNTFMSQPEPLHIFTDYFTTEPLK